MPMPREERELFCDYCGESMGRGIRYPRETQTCGKPECDRWARDEERAEREEAHRQLDRDRGWD